MAKATIEVKLDGERELGVLKHYLPSEDISGEILIIPDGDIRCKNVSARLQWRTEGRGDRDQGKVDELILAQGTLKAGMPTQYPFHFILSDSPWSYAGHYINIVWEIAVVIDIPFAKDVNYSQPFVMAPERSA